MRHKQASFATIWVLAILWFGALLLMFLGGCASMLLSEPTKVNPVDAKYIEAENQIAAAHGVLSELGTRELVARARGSPSGTVISRDTYDRLWSTLEETKKFLRVARDVVSTPGSCVQADTFKTLGLSGCFSREQVAVVVLAVIARLNEEMR